MGEISRLYAKTPDVQKSNSVLRIQRTKSSQPIKSPADRILFLQRTIGNQAVQRLIRSGTLQTKLKIGQPGDKYEQEADRMADAVMRMPEPGVQRQVEPKEEELQAKSTSGHLSEVNSNLESQIQSLKGGGQPLSENDRAFFEPRFGRDFSQVRVHMDANAAEVARAVDAKAFTVGRDVVFGAGQYSPETSQRKRLLAHELGHVIQQDKFSTIRFELSPLASPRVQRISYSKKIKRRKGTLFEKTVNGIQVRFFLYTGEIKKESQILPHLSGLTAQMKKMNRFIADSTYKVYQLFTWSSATSGFRIILGKPVVYIDTQSLINNGMETVTHEMGHAINYSYVKAYKPETKKGRKIISKNVIETMSDIFLQLQKTTRTKLADLGVSDPTSKASVVPIGHFMVDPWNWCTLPKNKCKTEHPWDDFDEFFASAFAGYLLKRKRLKRSIAKYGRMDAKVRPWGRRLLSVLKILKTSKYPRSKSTLKSPLKKVKRHIHHTVGRTPEVRKVTTSVKVEYVYISRPGASMTTKLIPPLLWLVDPDILKAIKVYIPKPSFKYRPPRPGYRP